VNPLTGSALRSAENRIAIIEQAYRLPRGFIAPRLALNFAKFELHEIFQPSIEISIRDWWQPMSVVGLPSTPVSDALNHEAEIVAAQADADLNTFCRASSIARDSLIRSYGEPLRRSDVRHSAPPPESICAIDNSAHTKRYQINHIAEELGIRVEHHLHYMREARTDALMRFGLWESDNCLPLFHTSFVANTSAYLEPALWNVGLSLEETVVLARAFGLPGCPRNTAAFMLREACNLVRKRLPHIKAVVTDINPNLGFTGRSFFEAGFVRFALKPSRPAFVGGRFVSRRAQRADSISNLMPKTGFPLLPNLTMIKPMTDIAKRSLQAKHAASEILIDPELYEFSSSGEAS